MMTVGQKIRRIRKQKGIGLRELARRTGMGPGALMRIEKGEVKSPRWDTVMALLGGIEAEVGDLEDITESTKDSTKPECTRSKQKQEVSCA